MNKLYGILAVGLFAVSAQAEDKKTIVLIDPEVAEVVNTVNGNGIRGTASDPNSAIARHTDMGRRMHGEGSPSDHEERRQGFAPQIVIENGKIGLPGIYLIANSPGVAQTVEVGKAPVVGVAPPPGKPAIEEKDSGL